MQQLAEIKLYGLSINRGVWSRGTWGAYTPYYESSICSPLNMHAPDEIRNSMFMPRIKKALMGGIGCRRQN